MTMKRNEKRDLGWASRGAVQAITNPVRISLDRRAGGDGFESGFAVIARRLARSVSAPERRAAVTRVTRVAKRRAATVRVA